MEKLENGKELTWEEWAREHTDPGRVRTKPEALSGLLVLDMSYGNFAGLFCSSTLAEFGARVIRVEPPEGDVARKFSPFGLKVSDTGLAYIAEARNKEHITLNIETERGREILRTLVKKADVLIETFPAGYMSELGVGYPELKEINPGLVYVAINVFGQYGPEARKGRKVSEVVAEALSGLVYVTGEPEGEVPEEHRVPTKHGNWMAWYAGGGFAALAALAALHFRNLTGKGQLIDVSESESLMRFIDYNCLWYHAFGNVRERVGNYDPAVFPYTYVKSKDGYTFLAGFSDINWTALTTIMKNPELRERYPTIFERLQLKNEMEIHRELEKWAQNYTSDEILAMVQEYDRTVGKGVVATGRVNTPKDTVSEDNWWERGVFKKVKDPIYGELLIQMPPWKMTETPPRVKSVCKPVGADNGYVYGEFFGFGKKALEELKKEGVI
ncbi:MAG: CoA transferase [Deltaproteobacteria bacterium]|nr:MAG: CoA transferase [Deltaproteobacteria bacterium]